MTYDGRHRVPASDILVSICEPLDRFADHRLHTSAVRSVYGRFMTAGRVAAEAKVRELVELFEDSLLSEKVSEVEAVMSR